MPTSPGRSPFVIVTAENSPARIAELNCGAGIDKWPALDALPLKQVFRRLSMPVLAVAFPLFPVVNQAEKLS
jgi:hypothetical protein